MHDLGVILTVFFEEMPMGKLQPFELLLIKTLLLIKSKFYGCHS